MAAQGLRGLRFTPTGVGTAERIGLTEATYARFTPTGVGTAYPSPPR